MVKKAKKIFGRILLPVIVPIWGEKRPIFRVVKKVILHFTRENGVLLKVEPWKTVKKHKKGQEKF